MGKGASALTGAGVGAAAGTAVMPGIGTAVGAIGGAIGGYLLGEDDPTAPTYTPTHANFQYGLGPSDSYASLQSERYNQQQAQLAALGAHAYNRDAPTQALPTRRDFVASQGQNYLQGADTAGRASQIAALGGLQNQVGALNRFANQAQGPSAAQAQLQAGTDAAARQQYGFARSQAGGGGAALRNAAFNAAGISGNAANTAAMLRAQETAQHRGMQLQALGAAQQGAGQAAGYSGQLRGMDQGFAQAQAGQANYDSSGLNQYNQQQQQLEFGVGQNNQNAALAQGRANDAMTLGTLGLSQQFEGLRNQNAAGQAQAGYNYEAARAQGAGLGIQGYQAQNQNSNTQTAMGLGAIQGGLSAYGQMSGGGGGTTSDIRAKKDIKPVSVLEALGGRYSPEQTRQLYQEQTAGPQFVRGEVAAAEAGRARNDFDPGMREFNPGHRPGFGTDVARRRQLVALGARNGMEQWAADRDPEAFDRWADAQGWTRTPLESDAPDGRPSAAGGTSAARIGVGRHLIDAQQGYGSFGDGRDAIPNLRPAQAYEYSYRDPERHGEGRFVGPMAQDLEHLPGVVQQAPDGTKAIDAPRLTLANTAAVSEQQRRLDELEAEAQRRRRLEALGFSGGVLPPINTQGFETAYQGGN